MKSGRGVGKSLSSFAALVNSLPLTDEEKLAIERACLPVGYMHGPLMDQGKLPPPGWLLVDGQEESSAEYPELANVLGAKGARFELPGRPYGHPLICWIKARP